MPKFRVGDRVFHKELWLTGTVIDVDISEEDETIYAVDCDGDDESGAYTEDQLKFAM
jgi:heat shock protein HspQ